MTRFGRIIRGLAGPTIFFVSLVVVWQVACQTFDVPEYVLPLPTEIMVEFWRTAAVQSQKMGQTAVTTILGLSIALVSSVFLALGVVYIAGLKAIVLPLLAIINSSPKIAFAPLFVIWFGLDMQPKVWMAFLLAVYPIFVSSLTGLSEIEPDVLDLSEISGGTKWRIFTKVRLMNAFPYITDALKVAFPLALVGSIVGEFISGNRGIGFLILTGQFNLNTALVFASLLSVTIFTVAGIVAIVVVEHMFLGWRPSRR